MTQANWHESSFSVAKKEAYICFKWTDKTASVILHRIPKKRDEDVKARTWAGKEAQWQVVAVRREAW